MNTSRIFILPIVSPAVESEEQYVCHWTVFYEMSGRYIASFSKALAHYSR